jgi:hypothetical protein
MLSRALGSIVALAGISGCVSQYDHLFSTDYEARHEGFKKNLNLWVGQVFNHPCIREGKCPATTLQSGQVRYTLPDYGMLKGCTYWFDTDAITRIVVSVGYTGGPHECFDID